MFKKYNNYHAYLLLILINNTFGENKKETAISFLRDNTEVNKEYKLENDINGKFRYVGNGKKYLQYLYNPKLSDIIPGYSDSEKEGDIKYKQENYLNSIVAICWALFDMAVSKGQPFTGGNIIIEDPKYVLYNFLIRYAKIFNPDLRDPGYISKNKAKPDFASKNCLAYIRRSTHFNETKNLPEFDGQYGIDVRYGQDGKIEKILPANKSHILFGKLPTINNRNYIFIKFETYGLCQSDGSFLLHGKELIKLKALGVKNISRREDVPEEITEKFNKIIKNFTKEEQDKAKKNKIIRDIYKYINQLSAQFRTQEIKDFIKYLEKYDHVEVRRGNEVILDANEIKKYSN